ncbi:hypothetical protein [Maioricimonas rarisocia]|nr:hypothetical protein [Maioricimonas rarisocia]
MIRSSCVRTLWTVLLVASGTTFMMGCGGSEPEPEPEAQAVEQEELSDQLQTIEQEGE